MRLLRAFLEQVELAGSKALARRQTPGDESQSLALRNAARCRRVIAPFHTAAIADNSRRVAQAVLPDILT